MASYQKAVPGAGRFKNMSAEQKLNLSLKLYYEARELKAAALKHQFPEASSQEIQEKVKNLFFYART